MTPMTVIQGYPPQSMRYHVASLFGDCPTVAPPESAPSMPSIRSIMSPESATLMPTMPPRFDKDAFLESWRERSAIMSIECGLSPADADEKAFADVWPSHAYQTDAPEHLDILPPGNGCGDCHGLIVELIPDGLRCFGCGRMVWLTIPGGIVRADAADFFES
jgi:hypothetical protein